MAERSDERNWQMAVRMFDNLGFDLTAYKRPQLTRRLESFMQRQGFDSMESFAAALSRDPSLYRQLHTYLTIHVTDFFRDPEYWEHLRGVLSEQRQHGQQHWKVWSAGCSWGAEPISAALLFEDLGLGYDIVATDSDETVLDQARRGLFTEEQLQKAPTPYRRFFRPQDAHWTVGPLPRGTITYRRHDITTPPPAGPFNLIICRNLIIYFESSVRSRILQRFGQALTPEGFLFLGATETFLEHLKLGFRISTPSIYQRVPKQTKAK